MKNNTCDEYELLFDEIYEKTKDWGRTQFVKLLMIKERENRQLKQLQQQKEEAIDKAIEYIDDNSHYYSTDIGDAFFSINVEEEDFIQELLKILKGE